MVSFIDFMCSINVASTARVDIDACFLSPDLGSLPWRASSAEP